MLWKHISGFCHTTPDFGRPASPATGRRACPLILPQPGRTLSTCGLFLNPALKSISSDEGAGRLSTDKESSMTRHIKPYRYEIQHGDDADFVAYQHKSSDGVWQTISVWMIPQPD
jgi:hypothetical protein